MKVFIIAAISADGFIGTGKTQSSVSWTSKEDKKRFVELTRKAGVIVMGRTTFETIGKPLPGRRNIIYTRKKISIPGVECSDEPPLVMIERLRKEDVSEIAICGGASIYTLFMEAGVVNTLYLTIEPLVFGSGIRLFSEEIPATLELVSAEQKNPSVFLEYNVLPKV